MRVSERVVTKPRWVAGGWGWVCCSGAGWFRLGSLVPRDPAQPASRRALAIRLDRLQGRESAARLNQLQGRESAARLDRLWGRESAARLDRLQGGESVIRLDRLQGGESVIRLDRLRGGEFAARLDRLRGGESVIRLNQLGEGCSRPGLTSFKEGELVEPACERQRVGRVETSCACPGSRGRSGPGGAFDGRLGA